MENERAARISLIAAELNAEAMATFAEVQGMMAANEKRRRSGMADAYDEEAFVKLRDSLMQSASYCTERMHNV
jgi:hypothetical protein